MNNLERAKPISRIFDYVNGICCEDQTRLSEVYGTESFCWFLYAMILMRKPKTIVELGTGAACTTSLAGYAAKLNRHGHVWSIDDGSDWEMIRQDCAQVAAFDKAADGYGPFIERLLGEFEISDYVTFVNQTITPPAYFAPEDPIDLLFLDLGDTGPVGCLSALRYYLPRVAPASSIFIDRASTIFPARMLVASIVDGLNRRKIPKSLLKGLPAEEQAKIRSLAEQCSFKLLDLVEPRQGKVNTQQNSRLWISIEAEDFLPPEDVDSFLE